jgi:nitroreductase
MDLFEAILWRSSVRAFSSEPVSEQEVEKLLEAAIRAPTAGGLQPWRFIVVRSPEVKSKLVDVARGQSFIAEAPVVIVACADLRVSEVRYHERGSQLYAIQDTAAATQNLLLAACALGLGTCWVGAFDEDLAHVALDLPEAIRPLAIIPVGHPASQTETRHRRPLEEVVHAETYSSERDAKPNAPVTVKHIDYGVGKQKH